MSTISLDGLRVAGCQIEAAAELPNVTLRLQGSAEGAASEDLEKLFAKMHQECVRLGAKEVKIDLRDLEFMSSSCFKSFVTWVLDIEQLPAEQRYGIVLIQSADRHWQRRSLHALESMGAEIITLE